MTVITKPYGAETQRFVGGNARRNAAITVIMAVGRRLGDGGC